MSLPSVAMLICGKPVEDCALRRPLIVKIQRGVNPQAAFMDFVGSVLGFEVAPNLFDKIWGHKIRSALKVQTNRRGLRDRSLFGGDLSILEQRVNHHVAAMQGALRIPNWGIDRWALRQAGQQCSLLER